VAQRVVAVLAEPQAGLRSVRAAWRAAGSRGLRRQLCVWQRRRRRQLHAHHRVGVMDRLIALLAALVGLIALGGALLVHNNATATAQRQATEIAELRDALKAVPASAPVPVPPAPAASVVPDTETAEIVAGLERRIASLESTASAQATEWAAARAALEARPDVTSPEPVTEVAAAEPAVSSTTPAAYSADGPTEDCIPLGTRFMSQSG